MARPTDDEILEQLKEKLEIDLDGLDDAFVEQPTLFYHISAAHQNATAKLDQIKLDLEQAEADLYVQMVKKAEEEQEKWTDTSIKRAVISSERIKKLEARSLALKQEVGKLLVMKEAYQQRGYALNKLADLFVANYFTNESGGKKRSEIKEDLAREAREGISKLRKERKARK